MSVAVHGADRLDPAPFASNRLKRDSFAWLIRHRPDDGKGRVHAWLRANDDAQLENRDDTLRRARPSQGASSDEEAVIEALTALCPRRLKTDPET